MLVGIAELFSALIVLISNFFSLNILSANIWFLMPVINIPLVFFGCLIIILSNKYKLGRITLQLRKSQQNIMSSKFYWENFIAFFFWMFIGTLINFYYFLKYPVVLSNNLFLASSVLMTGIVLIAIYIVEKLLYPELLVREFFIVGFGMIFLLTPLLYLMQVNIYPNTTNSFYNLQKFIYPENTSPFLFFVLSNIFLIPPFCIGLFFIIFGIYQFFRLRKKKVLLFSGIGLVSIFLPAAYFLIEIFYQNNAPELIIIGNTANLITPIMIGYFLVILFTGLILFAIGYIQQLKINNL